MAASRGKNKTLTLPSICIDAAELFLLLWSCWGGWDYLEVMTCPHQTMVWAPWTISHKYHSIIDFWLKKYLFYTGWHRNAFEMLLKFGLSWVLSGKNTGLTSQCGSWHNTSYGRHLQVRAKYWKKFMQLVITFTLQVEACSRAIS